jgi:hypothetical protein
VFSTGAPNCGVSSRSGGSILIFGGNPETLIDGSGRYEGATGRGLSDKQVRGGSYVVTRVHRKS